MTSGNILQYGYKMVEDRRHLALHVFIDLLIGGYPLLTLFHEVHGSRLREEHHIRIKVGSSGCQPSQKEDTVGVGFCRGNA